MKVIHGNKSIKQFKCEYCSYATHARPYLYEHRRSVHPEAREPDYEDTGISTKLKENLKCEKCNCGFSNKGSLQYHICESMSGLEQLYKCPKCDHVLKHGLFITHYKVIY